ncbi:MAG: hypothetical protein MZU91_10130 [Desulfosudis oleivorans]|nr:hypothetical protein [Desulfosudis oleivorans]
MIDANLEGILHLARATAQADAPSGRWNVRACKNLEANLDALQNIRHLQQSKAVTPEPCWTSTMS